MKFSSASGDIVINHVDQKVARECYVASMKVKPTNRPRDDFLRQVHRVCQK